MVAMGIDIQLEERGIYDHTQPKMLTSLRPCLEIYCNMGKPFIPLFDAFLYKHPKLGTWGPVSYFSLAISLRMACNTKLKFNPPNYEQEIT